VHWSSSAVGGRYCSTRKKEEVSCMAKMRMERPGRWSSLVKADGGGVSAKIPARWMVSDGETRTGGHRVRGVGWLDTHLIWGGGSVGDGLTVQWWQCLFMGAENIMEKGRGGGGSGPRPHNGRKGDEVRAPTGEWQATGNDGELSCSDHLNQQPGRVSCVPS
jgi:hypothetical protein